MQKPEPTYLSRRAFLWKFLSVPAVFVLAACSPETLDKALSSVAAVSATPRANDTQAQFLPPTPACGDDHDDDVTITQTEGPFYTPDTPQRTSFLEAGMTGTRMLVSGYVLATNCVAIPGALVDFWHCNDKGVYDNVGYKLRGHQFTDASGRFVLETIMPGLYSGRTRHFHVKVQAPNQPVLTTQLYFPAEPDNARDGIYNSALEMNVQDVADGSKWGTFNFVLNIVS